ncbi:MAG: PKD domain-containing protein [Flammeovirgaceae bacterium]
MKIVRQFWMLIGIGLLLSSCGDDDFPTPQSDSVQAVFAISLDNNGFAPTNASFNNTSVLREGVTDVSYTWNFGDGTISNEASPTHTYETPGDYIIRLVAVTGDDIDFMEMNITIKDPNALDAEVILIDASDRRIYNLDGTSFNVNGFGTGIAYDATNSKIYFTDADAGELLKADKDGSNMETVATGLSDPRDLALDVANGKAFVADRGVDAIIEVDLSNGNTSTFFGSSDDADFLLPVGIDFYDGNLYATCVDVDAESVWKSSASAAGFTRIIDFSAGGFGYGIAIDRANEKIYFDDSNSGQILQANLDGTGITSIVNTGNRVYGLSIDNTNNKMYWTERNSGSVFMADLDGANPVTLTSDFTDPRGLFHIE